MVIITETMGDMKLTPEIEAKGLKAYEQVRAFERLRSWRLPVSYAVFTLIPVLNGAGLWRLGYTTMAALNFLAVILFGAGAWFHWKRLGARYAKNLQVLEEMEAAYGDQLPWIQVENHFAALERLKQELEEEKRGVGDPPQKEVR